MEIYQTIRPLLFKLDCERVHSLALKALDFTRALPFGDDLLLALSGAKLTQANFGQEICGMKFYNPLGLAAGFDKDAKAIKPLSALGFGFLELGTITKIPQSGNKKPRLFRHEQEESLQNEMGFNNVGSVAFSQNLNSIFPFCIPLGVNIGRNKEVSNEDALLNYQKALEDVLNVGDYYVFNVSSPNTPHLRDLQNEAFVKGLFTMAKKITKKPLFIKISPDMEIDNMLNVCQKALDSGASGIIATNTTLDTSTISSPKNGGISGAALKDKSIKVLSELGSAFKNKAVIISVGGISSAQDVYERLKMGASLVQLYTSFIYRGPSICGTILKELDEMMLSDGFDDISEVIGAGV